MKWSGCGQQRNPYRAGYNVFEANGYECSLMYYPFSKSKISAMNTLKVGDLPGLFQVLDEQDVTHLDFMEADQTFFAALNGQSLGTIMTEAHYTIFSRKMESLCASWHYYHKSDTTSSCS